MKLNLIVIRTFEEKIALLSDFIVSNPIETEFGICTILKDSDGRKVEVYKNSLEKS